MKKKKIRINKCNSEEIIVVRGIGSTSATNSTVIIEDVIGNELLEIFIRDDGNNFIVTKK